MKKISFVLFIAVLVLTSCNRDVWFMEGEYSYKISGRVELKSADTTINRSIDDEIGVLRILSQDSKDEEVVLAFNPLGGSVVTTTARIDGKKIELQNFEKILHLRAASLTDEEFVVDVSGTGERYKTTIVFSLDYKGKNSDGTFSLEGNDLRMVAY